MKHLPSAPYLGLGWRKDPPLALNLFRCDDLAIVAEDHVAALGSVLGSKILHFGSQDQRDEQEQPACALLCAEVQFRSSV